MVLSVHRNHKVTPVDKLKCCFTSTETVRLLGTGAQDVHLDFHTTPELSKPVDKLSKHGA